MIFLPEELAEFSKDFPQLIREALDRGDIAEARKWLDRHEATKNMIHDSYVHWVAGLLTEIKDNWGEAAAMDVLERQIARIGAPGWTMKQHALREQGLRGWIEGVIDIWRQHCSYPGVAVEEDEEKVTVRLSGCGSGGRLVNAGAYEGPDAYARTSRPDPRTWGEKDVPIYCAHCAMAHELLPAKALGGGAQMWVHAGPFPRKPGDACVHHHYKDPAKIPAAYYERVGLCKGDAGTG